MGFIGSLRWNTLTLGILSSFTIYLGCVPWMAFGDPLPVRAFTLENGHQVYIQENHSRPIVTVDTWVQTGSVQEVPENNGVSHFLEHLLFKGTEKYPVGAFERIIESKGGEFNAATSQDFTHYFITSASPFFKEVLNLHADMLLNAQIPTDELDRERKVVQEEINRSLDNPQHKLFQALDKLMFPGHGYAFDTLGPRENIATIPREAILNYYHYWYQPAHLRTVIVGDVKTDEALQWVKEAFSKGEFAPPAAAVYTPPKQSPPVFPEEPQVKIIEDPKVSQAYTAIVFPGPSIEQRHDTYALDVAMQALGQGRSSRLFRNIIDRQQLAQTISAGNMTQQQSGLVYVIFQSEPSQWKSTTQAVMDELVAYRKSGIDPEEMTKVKTQFIKEFVFHNETTDGVAQAIGYNTTIGTLADYTDYIGNIQKVSQEDVMKALHEYLQFRKAVIVSVVPPKTAKSKEKTAKVPHKKGLKAQKEAGTPNATWILAQLKGKYIPQTQESTAELAKACCVERSGGDETLQKMVLPNGLTVVMKPWHEANTVAMKLFIKGGQWVESKPGVGTLVGRLLTQGTETRSGEDIHNALERLGMDIETSTEPDYLEISASAVNNDFGELYLLFEDLLLHPTFPETELAKEKKRLLQGFKASRDNPTNMAFENLSLAMYPNHPYGAIGKRVEAALPSITRNDLLDYYQQWFRPENMILSIVGDFEPKELSQTLENTFQQLAYKHKSMSKGTQNSGETQKQLPPWLSTPAPSLAQTQTVTDGKTNQAATWIGQGWLAPGIQDPDHVPLKVLNTFLGMGMSSRLFVELREKQGLAYSVGSLYPSRFGKSQFILYIGTDPKNEAKVLDGFSKEVQRLLKTPLAQQELEEAKDKLIGAFALAHETSAQQAFYLGFYETMGLGFQYDKNYPSKIQGVSAEDIQRVAQKYFTQPFITSIVAPDKQQNAQGLPPSPASAEKEKPHE